MAGVETKRRWWGGQPRGGGRGEQPRGDGGSGGVPDSQIVVVAVVEPSKGIKRGAGDDEPLSNLPASRTRSKHHQIS